MTSLIEHRDAHDRRYFTYALLDQFGDELSAVTLSRDFDIADTQSLKGLMKADQTPLSFKSQLHGIEIVSLKNNAELPAELNAAEGDIFMTNRKQLPLMIRTADCAAVIIYDPIGQAVANIHAGWRGIAQKAVAISVSELCKRYGSKRENLYATVSPMLGPCCAEFTDPEKELPHFMRPFFLEENHVDLWGAVENQLIGSGLDKTKIFNPRICTSCNPETFFSFRRDKDASGRFGTIVMLK